MTTARRDDDGRSRCCTRSGKIRQDGWLLNIRDDVLSVRIEPNGFRSDVPFGARSALGPKLYRRLLRGREA